MDNIQEAMSKEVFTLVRIFLLLHNFERDLMQNSSLDNFQKSHDVYRVSRSKHKGLPKAIMWRTSLMQKAPVSRDQSQIGILIACKINLFHLFLGFLRF